MKVTMSRAWATLGLLMLVWMTLPAPCLSTCQAQEGTEITPDNTVILSNETDVAFCRDFSILLKSLRPQWVILEVAEVPESVRDRNLIIVGGLDSPYTGEIITQLITPAEMAPMRQEGHYVLLEKASPWHEERSIYICAGADPLLIKQAAEEAIYTIAPSAQARRGWTFPDFERVPQKELDAYIASLQVVAEGEEMPTEAMRLDVKARPPRRISAEQAAEDVEHLFSVLGHSYCGYAFFEGDRMFDQAKENILQELGKKSRWSPDDLATLVYEQLGFIHDCHLRVGERVFCTHQDFWYDTSLELWKAQGAYYFIADNVEYQILTVNGQAPEMFTFPSLNVRGDPIYRLGQLSQEAPRPLQLSVQGTAGRKDFEISLSRSNFFGERFGEERVGGIPVVRVRTFGDYYSDELEHFIETGRRYKREPYLILDIRGNTGGNSNWPKDWISTFTGHVPAWSQILTELHTSTSMMGRANAYRRMLDTFPQEDAAWIERQLKHFEGEALSMEQSGRAPFWTGPFFPGDQPILNDTTLIVIVDGKVASSGEGLLSYLFGQVENVVVVGENSRGALTFGQVSYHQLPHSRLLVVVPIQLNVQLDMAFREEIGFLPDLWVPAGEALNYAVAAARQGTITTRREIPAGYFEQDFVPERPSLKSRLKAYENFITLSVTFVLGLIPAIVNRKRPHRFFLILGGVALALSVIMVQVDRSVVTPVFLNLAGIYLAVGGYKFRREKETTYQDTPEKT